MIKPTTRGNRVIVPGLVNVHSHSFQRAIRGRTEARTAAGRDTFWTWRETMYRAANRLSPDDLYHVARMAFLEMLLSGITTVGEFHYLHNAPDGSRYNDPNLLALQVIRAARDVGLRIVLLRTAYARAGWQQPANPLQARFLTPDPDAFLDDTQRLIAAKLVPVAIAPHSIRALPLDYLLRIAQYARTNKLPVHMHVAEQPAEVEQCLAEHGRRPVELLDEHGIPDSSFTVVHGIHVTEEEIGLLGRAKANVCACPTTERSLGDGIVPADRLEDAGACICLGSDSNVQIDLLEDARSLEYHLRLRRFERAIVTPENLFASATEKGASALAQAGDSGDFFTMDLNDPSLAGADDENLLSHLVFSAERTAIRDVFVNGIQVIQEGRHPCQDEIVDQFATVQRRLRS